MNDSLEDFITYAENGKYLEAKTIFNDIMNAKKNDIVQQKYEETRKNLWKQYKNR